MPYLVRLKELTIAFPFQMAMLLSPWMKLSRTGSSWSLKSQQAKIGTLMLSTAPESLVVRDDVGKPQEQGVMSTAASFPSVRNQGLSTSRRNKSLQKVLPGAATRNLHTTQPKYFAPTYSEVVNLTGLLKTKD